MVTTSPEQSTDQVDDLFVTLLRAGIVLSALLVLAGGILYIVRHSGLIPDFHTFHGEPATLRYPGAILRFALALHGRGIIQLGIILLILNPVLRLLMALASFVRQRDYLYIGAALIVLGILLFNMR